MQKNLAKTELMIAGTMATINIKGTYWLCRHTPKGIIRGNKKGTIKRLRCKASLSAVGNGLLTWLPQFPWGTGA